jgi:hypothetical protein
MKTKSILLVILSGLGVSAWAGPLQQKDVPAEAKWVAHLDVDRFKATQIGRLLGTKVLDPQLAKVAAPLKREFDFDFDWHRLQSITAYGTDLKKKPDANAVLIIKSDLDVQAALDTAADRAAAIGAEEDRSLRRVANADTDLYALGGKAYAALLPDKVLVVAKTRERVEEAVKTLRGKSPSLASTRKLTDFPAATSEFLVVGITEALDQHVALPPQAAALKSVTGGRLALSEQADQLAATLMLKANSDETVAQLQQVAQGLIALAALTKPDDQDLQQLTRSATVSTNKGVVTVGAQYPLSKAADELGRRAGGKRRKAE